MHHFYLPPAQCRPPLLQLTGGEAHHARDVLRLAQGDRVTVLDGAGRQFLCEALDFDRQSVSLGVLETTTTSAPSVRVTLIQAVPRGKIMESIIQKAAELGAARIVPLLSERVAIRLSGGEAKEKAEKWRQCAIEAIKQCGQPWLPEVEEPLALPVLLAKGASFDLALVGSLQGDGRASAPLFCGIRGATGSPSANRWRVDRAGRGFHRRGIGHDPRRRRASDRFRPAGLAQRNRRNLHLVNNPLRTPFRLFPFINWIPSVDNIFGREAGGGDRQKRSFARGRARQTLIGMRLQFTQFAFHYTHNA